MIFSDALSVSIRNSTSPTTRAYVLRGKMAGELPRNNELQFSGYKNYPVPVRIPDDAESKYLFSSRVLTSGGVSQLQ
ncbi:hypothetical protein KCP75_25550 [Salmonella enterica subsp. enterica]|nr:hypothetical protein KCP75_25550 [Salmonella enterica subsp. enterica]